jgi:hypothetical protein
MLILNKGRLDRQVTKVESSKEEKITHVCSVSVLLKKILFLYELITRTESSYTFVIKKMATHSGHVV